MKLKLDFKTVSLSVVWAWLILFALLPYCLILGASFLSHNNQSLLTLPLTLTNYHTLFSFIYLKIFLRSFYIAGLCTLICLFLAYPFAYFIAQAPDKIKSLLLLFTILPFWTSSLIRSYAMMAILKAKGLLNSLLLTLGIIHMPLQILYTNTAVMIGLVYNLLPFMILPLYANIERLDHDLIDAAKDLGATRLRTFMQVILPQTKPGILAGIIIVFLPAMTLFYVPNILGGAKSMLLGNLIENEFLFANDWPMGAAISIALTVIMLLMMWVYWRNTSAGDRKDLA